jgi:predicted Zn-dependent protease
MSEGKALEAKATLEELLATANAQPLFELAYSQVLAEVGQKEEAVLRLETALKNHPFSNPITLTLANLYLKENHAQKAITLLKQQTHHKGASVQNWKLLSIAYASNKQPARAHLAQAQFLKYQGDFAGALTQIKLAKKFSQSAFESQQIESFEQGMPTLKKKS